MCPQTMGRHPAGRPFGLQPCSCIHSEMAWGGLLSAIYVFRYVCADWWLPFDPRSHGGATTGYAIRRHYPDGVLHRSSVFLSMACYGPVRLLRRPFLNGSERRGYLSSSTICFIDPGEISLRFIINGNWRRL